MVTENSIRRDHPRVIVIIGSYQLKLHGELTFFYNDNGQNKLRVTMGSSGIILTRP